MMRLVWPMMLGAVGCTHLHSLSVTTIPDDRSRPVEATGERIVVLGINPDNDYADGVVADLAAQCPDGRVSGVMTRYERALVVPIFAYAHRVHAEGFCIKEDAQP